AGNVGGYNVANQTTIAPDTLKQTTQRVTRINPITRNYNGAHEINQQNTIAPITARQTTQNTNYISPLKSATDKERTREDVMNWIQNYSKDELSVLRDGGMPTLSGMNKGPNSDFTQNKVIVPLNIERDIYPDMSDTAT